MRCGVLIPIFAVSVLALATIPARAAPLSPEAKAAYDNAVTEYELGHYKEALADFEKVYTLQHLPALLFNIAQCHRLLGEIREAAAVYRSFIARDPDSGRADQARELLDQMEAALAKEEEAQQPKPLESPTAPPLGTTMNAPPLADPAEDLRLVEPPGPAASTPSPARSTPAIAGTPTPRKAVSVQGAAPERQPPSPQRTRIWTWVAIGGAASSTGIGAVLGAKSASTKSSLADSVHSGAQVESLQLQQVSDAHRANSFFVVSGALAAIGIACFVLRF